MLIMVPPHIWVQTHWAQRMTVSSSTYIVNEPSLPPPILAAAGAAHAFSATSPPTQQGLGPHVPHTGSTVTSIQGWVYLWTRFSRAESLVLVGSAIIPLPAVLQSLVPWTTNRHSSIPTSPFGCSCMFDIARLAFSAVAFRPTRSSRQTCHNSSY